MKLVFFIFFYCLLAHYSQSQFSFPGKTWQTYKDPAEAGWSQSGLDTAKKFADSIGSAAVFIVYKGVVLASWGDVERKFMCHSMRKSLINALYGMTVADGKIKLESNLAELGIDDSVNPLSNSEKEANVRDLLQSRSGIFLPAAYEGDPGKPPRGSHPHGTFWLYNNWDFNALGTILQKVTGRSFWDDFLQRVALPIGMEDTDSLDVFYQVEPKRSEHAAYTCKASSRDLARFGLLYLANGRWKGRQLIPEQWVKESTTPYSLSPDQEGYGYLWWTDEGRFKSHGMYSAAGYGGHHIFVFPKDSLVIVHRANTYENKSISLDAQLRLLDKILLARTQTERTDRPSTLINLPAQKPAKQIFTGGNPDVRKYVGKYQFQGEWMRIYGGKSGLMMDAEVMGKFYLQPLSESLFLVKDMKKYISFLFDKKGIATKMIYHDVSIESVSKD